MRPGTWSATFETLHMCVFVRVGFPSLSVVRLQGERQRDWWWALMLHTLIWVSKPNACFWPSTPSVTDAASFSKVLQLVFRQVNTSWVAHNETVGQQSPKRFHFYGSINSPQNSLVTEPIYVIKFGRQWLFWACSLTSFILGYRFKNDLFIKLEMLTHHLLLMIVINHGAA